VKGTKGTLSNIKDTLTVFALLGLPVGGAWAAVLGLWKSTGAQQISVHVLLVLSASVISVGIFAGRRIYEQHRKIAELKAALDAQKRPHRFQDDCTLDENTRMYRHKTRPGFFCVACAAENDRESPMIASSQKDWGWNCPVNGHHFVRGPAWHPPEPISRTPWSLGY
jgi:hypothetical protein